MSVLYTLLFFLHLLTFNSDRQIGRHTTVHACLSLTWHVDSCLTLWHFHPLLRVFLNAPDKLQPALSASWGFMLIPALWFVISSGVLCAYCAFWLAFSVKLMVWGGAGFHCDHKQTVSNRLNGRSCRTDEDSCSKKERDSKSHLNNTNRHYEILITRRKGDVRSQSATADPPHK